MKIGLQMDCECKTATARSVVHADKRILTRYASSFLSLFVVVVVCNRHFSPKGYKVLGESLAPLVAKIAVQHGDSE
jgi:hypothetical protein